jgi:DinB family protein
MATRWPSYDLERQVTFSNPAGSAAAAAAGYVRALLDLLGSRDPLEVLDELPSWLVRRVHGLPDTVLRRPEKPGKWSVIEVIQHLADSDLVAAFRTRMILTEDRPALQGYDQDRWASELHYRQVSLGQALEQLRALRTANLHLWKILTPAQLDRVGLHSERGPESAGHILRLMAGHDLVHRRQIDRILSSAP